MKIQVYKDVIVPENQRRGFLPFKQTNKEGREFKRVSKGSLERNSRRYIQKKTGAIELVFAT